MDSLKYPAYHSKEQNAETKILARAWHAIINHEVKFQYTNGGENIKLNFLKLTQNLGKTIAEIQVTIFKVVIQVLKVTNEQIQVVIP